MLVVRAIHGSDVAGGFVPSISVTVALVLSVLSLVLLIYFIHHVSSSIQASRIVRVIADDMSDTIPRLYPSGTGEVLDHERRPIPQERHATLAIERSGYIQTLDLNGLLQCAACDDLVIELIAKPGGHLVTGDPVARIQSRNELSADAVKAILNAFLMGGERTAEQEIRFQFQQLTDVIIRALSPGINDPFTALNGIHELAASLSLMIRRARVAHGRQDKDGVLRLIVPTPTVSEILDGTVGHIAIYGAAHRFVMGGLRRVLDVVERNAPGSAELETVQQLRDELDRRENAKSL